MHNTTASELTPEQQLAQIAAILARGAVRYTQSRRHNDLCSPQESSKSSEESLEVTANSSLSVSRRPGI
jgi:hypothetical protein